MSKLGDFRDYVTFRRVGRVQRADGGYNTTPADLVEVACDVRPLDAREGEQAGRLYGSTTYSITLHADDKPDDLTTDDAARWSTAPGGVAVDLNIRAIRQAKGRALMLEIIAEQKAVA